MGLLDKFFGNKPKPTNPDNSKLFKLLEIYQKQSGKGDSHKNVVLELMNGNSYLLLPSKNESEGSGTWTTTQKDTTLKLTCVYNLDGLKVLGAFTDEISLLSWAKKPAQYTTLSLCSITIERLLLKRNIARFVIDEAHCFSSWGQDFRVDYLYIGEFIKNLQQKKNLEYPIPVSCFTATAKQKVIEDIRNYFREKLNLNLEVFKANSGRTNLHYEVFRHRREYSVRSFE